MRRSSGSIRRKLLVDTLIPVYIVIFMSAFFGVVLAVVRFNHWELIFPFVSRFLPTMLVVYLFLFGVYILYVFNKTYFLQEDLREQGIIFFKKLTDFPKSVGILTFSMWVIAGLFTLLLLRALEMVDLLTNFSLSVLIVGFGPLVALVVRSTVERDLSKMVEELLPEDVGIDQRLRELADDRVRNKVMRFVMASLFMCASVVIVFSAEIVSRTTKDSVSEFYLDRYLRGESVPNQIPWRIGGGEESRVVDEHIRKAILYKLERGENVLYDYLSSSVFIFSRRENIVEGVFVPIHEAEDRALGTMLALFLGTVIVFAILFFSYSTSLGRYLGEVFLDVGKRNWLGRDEFMLLSLELISMRKKIEQSESALGEVREKAGYVLSHVFSDLVSVRAKINATLGDIKTLKISSSRMIQLTGKEVEEIELDIQDIPYVPPESIGNLNKMLRDVLNLVGSMISEAQAVSKLADTRQFSAKIAPERYLDSRFPAVESSIIKRVEMISNTISELESSIFKAAEVLKSVQANISKFREFLKMIDEILLDADRLKKKLFVLSMNISIVSGKAVQEDIMEEFSSIAKQMSSLLSDDLRKVEAGLRNLEKQIRAHVSSLSADAGDNVGESYMISAEGIAGRIDDIVEQLYVDIKYVLDQANDMRKSIKEISDAFGGLAGNINRFVGVLSKIEQLGGGVQEQIKKTIAEASHLEEQINSVSSKVEKFFRDSKNVVSRYRTMNLELVSVIKSVRAEITKVYEFYDRVETNLSKVVSEIEKVVEVIQESMYKVAGET